MSPELALKNQVSPLSRCYWPMVAPLIYLLSPLTAGEGLRERVQPLPRVHGTMGRDGLAEPAMAAVAMVGGGVPWFAVLDILRAIACDNFLSHFNYGNL